MGLRLKGMAEEPTCRGAEVGPFAEWGALRQVEQICRGWRRRWRGIDDAEACCGAHAPPHTRWTHRKQDLRIVNALASVAATLYKFAFDLRFLQSPPLGEWAEPFSTRQVGSSAMPFKRNPINAEKIDSLARYVAQLPGVAWHNSAHNLLERTLDDSANRRIILPNAFLAVDELLRVALRLIRGLRVDTAAVARTLATYGTFAATERLLMAAVKAGGDRQQLHEVIRTHSLAAWAAIAAGQPNPLIEMLAHDPIVLQFLSTPQVHELLDATGYVGDAPHRALTLAAEIRAALA